ncbi:hypothetical protein H0H92_001656 [Tricholoma furcatifolium]|nr:hypothetical protein H0H92_001656 [Tricholoma furcatifolium]
MDTLDYDPERKAGPRMINPYARQKRDGPFKGEELAGAFLGALMEVVVNRLTVCSSPEDFAEAWTVEVHCPAGQPSFSKRNASFQEVRDLAEKKLLSNAEMLKSNRRHLSDDTGHFFQGWEVILFLL